MILNIDYKSPVHNTLRVALQGHFFIDRVKRI